MNAIKEISEINLVAWILIFFALMFAIKEIIEIFSYFKNKLHIKTFVDENKENEEKKVHEIEDRIVVLEKHDNWQYNELGKISDSIDQINKNFLDKEINDLRWELLDFCSALTNGRKYNREAFEHIFRTYENYETILAQNNMTNGYVEESMQVVKEIYHDKLVNGEFRIE